VNGRNDRSRLRQFPEYDDANAFARLAEIRQGEDPDGTRYSMTRQLIVDVDYPVD
jgi:hypothetical protein